LKTVRIILVFLFTLSLFQACSPAKTDDNANQELADREQLSNDARPILGIYRGTLVGRGPGADAYPIELQIYLVDTPDGTSPNGQVKMLPTLRALYRRMDYPNERELHRSLLVRYYKDGTIIFSTESSTAANYQMNINGKIANGIIQGEANNLGLGILGDIRVAKQGN
jgi:hypothetical protein